MDSLFAAVRNFARDEGGITAIEYGLIAAVIVVAITTGFTSVSAGLDHIFTDIKTKLGVTS
ncbi:Flp family type IVb pilin [Pseudoduganella ginsengisoli]|uniref:Flp family type IVb pilin n=1 Tax=Pseudoduganella ginsengisoli TaxID=1462440 RepID=A0A6L6Q234_9BURK|nr:Flp family type IVb pilin [Pseudoduganella ginsengisoli]MTW03474.1 Flp family type IVb pilin [Pseudoduganella ginsengisoli]